MEGESGVIRSIIDEFDSTDIERDQIEGESGFTRGIIDRLHSLNSQGDQMAGESCVTRSVIDEVHSSEIVVLFTSGYYYSVLLVPRFINNKN